MKTIRYIIEAAALYALVGVFSVLPPATASACGGWLGRMVGMRLAANRKAVKNLARAFPTMSQDAHLAITRGMWDNLGRVVAEYPHLKAIARERVEIIDPHNILNGDVRNTIFIGGHLSNWEILAPTALLRKGTRLDLTYRPPNNPWVDRLLIKARTLGGEIACYPKSPAGGRAVMKALKGDHNIGILIDQKYNEGIEAEFFGHPAMTNPAFVTLARKFNARIVMVQNERLPHCRFRLTIHQPLEMQDDTLAVINDAHRHLESWIAAQPSQWTWLHRRWDSKILREGQSL